MNKLFRCEQCGLEHNKQGTGQCLACGGALVDNTSTGVVEPNETSTTNVPEDGSQTPKKQYTIIRTPTLIGADGSELRSGGVTVLKLVTFDQNGNPRIDDSKVIYLPTEADGEWTIGRKFLPSNFDEAPFFPDIDLVEILGDVTLVEGKRPIVSRSAGTLRCESGIVYFKVDAQASNQFLTGDNPKEDYQVTSEEITLEHGDVLTFGTPDKKHYFNLIVQ